MIPDNDDWNVTINNKNVNIVPTISCSIPTPPSFSSSFFTNEKAAKKSIIMKKREYICCFFLKILIEKKVTISDENKKGKLRNYKQKQKLIVPK